MHDVKLRQRLKLVLVLCLAGSSLVLLDQRSFAEAGGPKVLRSEPGAGELDYGVKVLIDDGTCPPGKIKQLFRASAKTKRDVKCIAWKGTKSVNLLKKEPGAGKLPAGVKILVDDGTCPAGKIKQVTGGGKGQGRQRACIAKR